MRQQPYPKLGQKSKKNTSIILSQMKAIVINNIIVNHRCRLFWKEIAMIISILLIAIIQTTIFRQISLQNQEVVFQAKFDIMIYNVLAMILIARASVMVHMDNRKNFLYFRKAYGVRTLVYILTWVFYSLILGAFKFFIYILIVYYYMKANHEYFSRYFFGYGAPNQQFFLSFGQFCINNFYCYLSLYSYCLLLAIIIPHNQIGLKLLTPFIATGIACLKQPYYASYLNRDKQVFLNPIGWLTNIYQYGILAQEDYFAQETYIKIFIAQFTIPLFSAIIIEFCIIKRFQIKQIFIKIFTKLKQKLKTQLNEQLMNRDSEMQSILIEKPLIKINHLVKQSSNKLILNDINLTISQGQFIMLYGRNGAGKSTLLKILTNIQNMTSGTIDMKKEINFGVSLQQNFFEGQLTVRQNLLFYANLKGIDIHSEDNSILQYFQLIDFADKQYYKISGGNRKKLSIACAFLGDNDAVILDQPTMGIDFAAKRQIQKMLRRQLRKQKNMAIIISTSVINLNQFNNINKVWILDEGQIILNQKMSVIAGHRNFVIGTIKNDENMQKISNFCKNIEQKQISTNLQKEVTHLRFQFEEYNLKLVTQCVKLHQLLSNFQFSLSNNQEKLQKIYQEIMKQKGKNQNTQQNMSNFKLNYQKLNPKSSFFNLILATLVIRVSQALPSILDWLYYAFIPLINWGYTAWIIARYPDQFFNVFLLFYPSYCNFMYSDISVVEIAHKECYYQTMIFKMGMKKIPYWFATYFFYIILMFIPFLFILIFVKVPLTVDITSSINLVLLFQLNFIAISYFLSMFFASSYLMFSFVSIIMTVAYNICLNLNLEFQFYTFNFQNTIKTILDIFIPYYQYAAQGQYLHRYLVLLGSCALYAIVFFLCILIIFFIKNKLKKGLNRDILPQEIYEGAMNEKIRVQGIVQRKQNDENAAIVVSNVYLKYSRKILGIKQLNLIAQKGRILGLIGMNGSGKSTTIKLITNQLFKTLGNVFFDGQQINSQTSDIYQKLSISPQNNYLIKSMSVHMHLRTIGALKGIPLSQQKETIDCLLKLFDLEDYEKMEIRYLSGGNKRKIKFISALIGKPKYLLMDQPTLGVDSKTQRIFGRILTLLTEQFKSSCIYITHQMNQIDKYCSKIAIMKKGGLILSDYSKNLIEKYGKGVHIILYSTVLDQALKEVNSALQEKIRVFQVNKQQNLKHIKLLIPYQTFNFDVCLQMIIKLKQDGKIYGYDVKNQGWLQAFNYILDQHNQIYQKPPSIDR